LALQTPFRSRNNDEENCHSSTFRQTIDAPHYRLHWFLAGCFPPQAEFSRQKCGILAFEDGQSCLDIDTITPKATVYRVDRQRMPHRRNIEVIMAMPLDIAVQLDIWKQYRRVIGFSGGCVSTRMSGRFVEVYRG
jgi:hypothetical protein